MLGCTAEKPGREAPDELLAVPIDTLTSTEVVTSPFFGSLTAVAVIDDRILLVDGSGEPFLHLVDPATGTVVRSMGRHGQGPREYGVAPMVAGQWSGARGRVALFDAMIGRLSVVSIGDADASPGESQPRAIPELPVLQVRMMDGGGSATTRWDAARGLQVTQYDSLGTRTASLDSLAIDDARLPLRELSGAYSHTLCVRPESRDVALVYRYTGRIDLVVADRAHVVRAALPFTFLPHLAPNPLTSQLAFKSGEAGTRRAYLDCVGSSTRLYALFDGGYHHRLGQDPVRTNSVVHAFDWDGKMVGAIQLDHAARAIAIDASGRILYSVTGNASELGPALRRTNLETVTW
ncbi:MAG: hypothetical protein KA267_00245 [Gemmatimonadales bacterium]|nr:hypothetical protein [Gemmatimonadales bacterium]MBP6571241.1 hypothetical protein [Gemmatimonadales bacterium]